MTSGTPAMGTASPTLPDDAARRLLHSLHAPSRILVAISGGSDSTGLLIALHSALSQSTIPHSLVAATVDHALRPGSADEALAVSRLCASLGIPHLVRTWQGEKPSTGIPAAAREARYGLLADAATALGADVIVTGHTADDQDETITMRARRGGDDGLGLSGMARAVLFDRRIWVLRPFLEVRRQAIRDMLDRRRIGWIDDPSNVDRRFERVRVRLEGSPPSPALPDDRAANRRRLSDAAADLVSRFATIHAGCLIRLSPQTKNAPPEVLRHALATLVAIAGGRPHRPGAGALDRLMRLVATEAAGRTTLSGALIQCRRDGIFLLRENRDVLPRPLAAHQTLIWDGRFSVTNRTDEERIVEPGRAPLPATPDALLTPAIRRHIGFILPEIRRHGNVKEHARTPAGAVVIEPAFPLFDRFLSDTDLALADSIARLFGRKAYLPPPA